MRRWVLGPEAHPNGRHLAAVAGFDPGRSLTIPCDNEAAARKLAASIRDTRDRKQWGLPGTYDVTATDPRGTGVGIFLVVQIRVQSSPPAVVLTNDPTFSRATRTHRYAVGAPTKRLTATKIEHGNRRPWLRRLVGRS